VAVDEHAAVVREDEEARVRRARLLGERVDHLARLLVLSKTLRHRGEEWRGELGEAELDRLVLVAHQKSGHRDGRSDEADEHDREVREEEPPGDGAHDYVPGGTSL